MLWSIMVADSSFENFDETFASSYLIHVLLAFNMAELTDHSAYFLADLVWNTLDIPMAVLTHSTTALIILAGTLASESWCRFFQYL